MSKKEKLTREQPEERVQVMTEAIGEAERAGDIPSALTIRQERYELRNLLKGM